MDEEEESKSGDEGGGAGWLATFADLMSLLMCFFVLLLSFSEMDVLKFKRLAGSMRNAFGVQAVVNANSVPKGTSIIAQEYSPGKPDPTPLREIWQKTEDQIRDSLDVECQDLGSSNSGESGNAQREVMVDKVQDLVGETEKDAIEIASALSKEIAEGVIEVETSGRTITVRIKEHGTFASGSADLSPNFKPVLKIVRGVLEDTDGMFVVEGHTDNQPISTARFRSNWALSSARAVSVAHALFGGPLTQDRFSVAGFADTRPLVSHETPAGRTRNRRVEVVIRQGLDDDVKQELEVIRAEDPALFQAIKDELIYRFELEPDEIF